jgi:hypothetical protein
MMLKKGERVYWGAPEIIYLEGTIRAFDEKAQTVLMRVERATPHSAHLIGNEIIFAANGLLPLTGETPPGTTGERRAERQPPPMLDDDEKVRRAAAVAVHQQFGYTLSPEMEEEMITRVTRTLEEDDEIRIRIITSMNEILRREF